MTEPVKNAPNTRGRPFTFGNPGRPRGAKNRRTIELAIAARQYSAEALGVLVSAMRHSPDWDIRVRAADLLLDRGFGKAPMDITLELQPLNFATMSDSELAAAIARLEVYVASAGPPSGPLIEHDPLREIVVDEVKS
jgi:hypothetical protein